MAQSIDFKIGFLEKIGTPLLSAIIAEQSAASDVDRDDKQSVSEAKNMAGLLGTSVSLSSDLAGLLELGKGGEDAESVRIALASVAARIIADYQVVSGKMPDEATVKRLLSAMETALMFSDHFAPDAAHIARLSSIDPEEGDATDEAQINVQYMNIMVPVVSAVADYSFGRNEKKLVLGIAEHLTAATKDMLGRVAASETDAIRLKRLEIRIMKAAVKIFIDCYRQETARVRAMSDDERARLSAESGTQLPMDHLWESFATRFAMLGVLAGLPDDDAAHSGSVTPQPTDQTAQEQASVSQAGPAEHQVSPPQEMQQAAPAPVQPPVEETQTKVAAEGDGDDNPMSFFVKKPQSAKTEGENSGGTMV